MKNTLSTLFLLVFFCFHLVAGAVEYGTVTASTLNLRDAPQSNASIVTTVVKGTKLKIHKVTGSWLEVTPPRPVTGYIFTPLLNNDKVRTAANLRVAGRLSATSLGVLPAGTKCTILSRGKEWTKVRVSAVSTLRVYAGKSYVSGDHNDSSSAAELSGINKSYGIAVYDVTRGKMLWSQRGQRKVSIASLTKMMTLLLALETIDKDPDISMNTKVKVSASAAGTAPTKAGLVPGKFIVMRELLSSMIIKSCNDCAALVAEYFGKGSSAAFIRQMNDKAKALGMHNTTFYNPHGLPGSSASKDNCSTPEDMVILAKALMRHPQAREWVKQTSVRLTTGVANPMTLQGHTPLLGKYGVNGVKTGYTNRAGSCVATHASTKYGNYIVIITGCESAKARNATLEKIMKWLLAKKR